MAAKPRATPLQVCEHCRREFSSRARWCPHCNLAVGEPIRMHEEVAYGVTFRNDDGIERQEVLHRLARRPCDLELVREADGEWRIERRENWLLDGNPDASKMLGDLRKVRRG